jgi:ssDNA-binding Zn-finger/Zn-ribbon topoisomerase 1
MVELHGKKKFPCPVCAHLREVKLTKKKKPYITCDPCGIQLFVRGPLGIAAFNRLLDRAEVHDLWTRLAVMERRFYLQCPACDCRFWIEPSLLKTSLFDGSCQGFRCPAKGCREVVPWKSNQ